MAAASARAANPCADGGADLPLSQSPPGSGIGGTGRSTTSGGIEGTGNAREVSGTGHDGGDGARSEQRNRESGIGGTGRGPKEPGDGGIGGTGYVRGIFGTVTGYASLCVAGIEVHYDGASVAADGSVPRIGETVEILAVGDDDDTWAPRISRSPVLIGPIETVDGDSAGLRILGQRVVLDAGTRTLAPSGEDVAADGAALSPGDRVRVSGMRNRSGDIVATRVDPSEDDQVLVVGRVSLAGSGWIEIGGRRLGLPAPAASGLHSGDEVAVTGHLAAAGVTVDKVGRPLALLSGGGLRRVDVETILEGDRGSIAVGARRLEIPPGEAPGGRGRVLVRAAYTPAGALVFERAVPSIPSRPVAGQRPGGPKGLGARRPGLPGHVPPDGPGPALPPVHDVHPGPLLPPERPLRPDRPERPERPAFPDRPPPRPPRPGTPPPPPPPPPPRTERPGLPERPSLPQRPNRPERPPARPFLPTRG